MNDECSISTCVFMHNPGINYLNFPQPIVILRISELTSPKKVNALNAPQCKSIHAY